MQAGEWWHSIDHNEPCRVVDTETLWGQASCLVWLPRRSLREFTAGPDGLTYLTVHQRRQALTLTPHGR